MRSTLIAITIILITLIPTLPLKGENRAFDNIRPIAEAAKRALEEGDSVKARNLFTEAVVRGQEWPESEEELSFMGNIVNNVLRLRAQLNKEDMSMLMLQLMVRPGIEAVNKKENTYGGTPQKIPSIPSRLQLLDNDSIFSALRTATDLMANGNLKECEKLLISLYTITWEDSEKTLWRHAVTNKLGLLYIKLGTIDQAIDILRQNKLDMDPDPQSDEFYVENLIYLAIALKEDRMKLLCKCYLETADELASRLNLDLEPIINDLNRVFTEENIKETGRSDIERFIYANDKNLCFLTESQRLKRWEKLHKRWKNRKLDLIDSVGRVNDINACLNAFQYEKQLLLRSTVKTMAALKNSDDKEAMALTDSLIKTRQKIVAGPEYYEKQLTAEYERIQKTLMHHHVMNGFEKHLYTILSAGEIAQKLGRNEAFVDFGTLEPDDGERYYAIIISPSVPDGKIVPLCTVEELEVFMEETKDEESRRMVGLRYGNDFLYKKIWEPIIAEVGLAQKIFYCPVGIMGLIMPDAIKSGEKYLGEDFDFHILSSAEALGSVRSGESYMPELLFSFCAIDYFCNRLALIANARMYGAQKTVLPDIMERDTGMRSAFSSPNSIPPLHNPEDFDWLEALCEKHHVPAMKVTGFNASEHALKFLSGRKAGTLNIVTHAFSLPKRPDINNRPSYTTLHRKTRLNDELEIEYLPLYRSGIMLSGAERAWCGRDVIGQIEDGLVFAEELSVLDLTGVDLLTLMACDTGNGEIDPDEGVIGLRRALKIAGCKTLITTAWNLDKEAGDAYLKEFYTNLLEGRGISVAHRRAQLELIRRFDNPYYWAVFQLID